MPGADNVALEAPVLVALFVGLIAWLKWGGMRALRLLWMHTIGWLFLKAAAVSIPTGFFGRIHPLGFLQDANTAVMNWFATEILAADELMGKAFKTAADLQIWIIRETWGLAKDLYHLAGWTIHQFVPSHVKAVTQPISSAAHAANVAASAASAAASDAIGRARSAERTLKDKVLGWIKKYAVYAIPGAIALPGLLSEWRTFNRRWERWKKRIIALELGFGAVAFAGYMANALGLGRANWRCITRGNIGRFARGLCRAPTWLLDIFLLEAFTAFTILDLCDFIKAEVKLAEWFRPLLMKFVDVDEWLIQNCNYDAPAPLNVAPLRLPSGKYGLTLNEDLDRKLGLAA